MDVEQEDEEYKVEFSALQAQTTPTAQNRQFFKLDTSMVEKINEDVNEDEEEEANPEGKVRRGEEQSFSFLDAS